jgi:hypothetical protein
MMEALMTRPVINFKQKFALFQEQWKPKVIAEMTITSSSL